MPVVQCIFGRKYTIDHQAARVMKFATLDEHWLIVEDVRHVWMGTRE